jgi:hypothetical protein
VINHHQEILTWRKSRSGTIDCEINLKLLFEEKEKRERFDANWKDFLASDPYNPRIYRKRGNKLIYRSEQLIPTKKDKRPPLLMVFGNPATRSVAKGMFFSFRDNGKENRFWKSILKPARILELPFNPDQSIEKLNTRRRQDMLNLKYDSSFCIGLSVFISMPSAAGGKWGGVAGIRRLLGAKAFRKLERAEQGRVLECAKEFVNSKGAVVAFQKNAWNGLRSDDDPEYNINLAKTGRLKGTLKGSEKVPILCVAPTRLSGPCRKVLKRIGEIVYAL